MFAKPAKPSNVESKAITKPPSRSGEETSHAHQPGSDGLGPAPKKWAVLCGFTQAFSGGGGSRWRSPRNEEEASRSYETPCATIAPYEKPICKFRVSQFDAKQGDTECAAIISLSMKTRRRLTLPFIFKYRTAAGGGLAASRCKHPTFTKRPSSSDRTGKRSN